MLAPAESAALNQKLRRLHEAQVMQGAIVLVDNLNGMSDFDYGMAVFQRCSWATARVITACSSS